MEHLCSTLISLPGIYPTIRSGDEGSITMFLAIYLVREMPSLKMCPLNFTGSFATHFAPGSTSQTSEQKQKSTTASGRASKLQQTI